MLRSVFVRNPNKWENFLAKEIWFQQDCATTQIARQSMKNLFSKLAWSHYLVVICNGLQKMPQCFPSIKPIFIYQVVRTNKICVTNRRLTSENFPSCLYIAIKWLYGVEFLLPVLFVFIAPSASHPTATPLWWRYSQRSWSRCIFRPKNIFFPDVTTFELFFWDSMRAELFKHCRELWKN